MMFGDEDDGQEVTTAGAIVAIIILLLIVGSLGKVCLVDKDRKKCSAMMEAIGDD